MRFNPRVRIRGEVAHTICWVIIAAIVPPTEAIKEKYSVTVNQWRELVVMGDQFRRVITKTLLVQLSFRIKIPSL
jgi:hypothetical protein